MGFGVPLPSRSSGITDLGENREVIAAIARFPVRWVFHNAGHAAIASYGFLLMLVAYDLWSTRKIHGATLLAGGFLIFAQQIRLPIGKTAARHSFAARIQSLAR